MNTTAKCSVDEFACHFGRNIEEKVVSYGCEPKSHVCNKVGDCSDKSDEKECGNFITISSYSSLIY